MTGEADRFPSRWCGGRNRHGTQCKRPAGWGTDHVGWGRCKLHGGNTPNGRRYAYRLEALGSMPRRGGGVWVEPTDALLFCVHREAGRQAWLRAMLEVEAGDDCDVADS